MSDCVIRYQLYVGMDRVEASRQSGRIAVNRYHHLWRVVCAMIRIAERDYEHDIPPEPGKMRKRRTHIVMDDEER